MRWLFPDTRGGALWRFVLAAVVVVLFTATTTAVAGLLQFKQFAKELSLTPALQHARITVADAGAPQTLLLVGSDHRAGQPYRNSNTDTMMLVRLDASSSTINVLSIPRDLKVLVPQGSVMGSGKINSTYSIGGINLLVRTLQQQVFHGLVVNHIIDVNFGGFSALVNAIGCVYTDVDRRYFHHTAPDPADNWASIDIQPGYQKLCGSDALDFVRFRHFDTDLVRNARQQDFLRWAKSQFSSSALLDQRDKLITIFGQHTQTDSDLHTTDGLIKLFDLVAFSAGHTVKQIPFPAQLQNCVGNQPCYVLGDPAAEQRAYQAFLTPTRTKPPGPAHAGGPAPAHPGGPPPPAPVTPALTAGKGQARALGPISMPVYVPGQIANGSQYCTMGMCADSPESSYPRNYTLQDQSGAGHPAYRLTLELNPIMGQFYGIQGTTWQNPPILAGPHDTRFVNGKQLLVYFNGRKVTLVAWHGPGGLFWVSNTLTDDLSGAQMIAIAASLTHA